MCKSCFSNKFRKEPKMAATKVLQKKGSKNQGTVSAKPKKLSKLAEWRKKHPNGFEVIYCDLKAVLK